MSALQVGHGFMTLRSRMARPVATGLSGTALLACIMLKPVSLILRAVMSLVNWCNSTGRCCCDWCSALAPALSGTPSHQIHAAVQSKTNGQLCNMGAMSKLDAADCWHAPHCI